MSKAIQLNFAKTKRLDPRITFTRASTATVTDEMGVIKIAAVNQPRFDHDPVTGECKGLLIEEARTNLTTYSAVTNANWFDSVTGVLDDSGVTAPDGTTSSRLTAGSTVASTQVRCYHPTGISYSIGNQYTISFYAKKGNITYVFTNISTTTVFGATSPYAFFNLDTGAVATHGSSVASASMVAVGNGWYRCSMTTIAAIANNANVFTYLGHSTSSGAQTHNATAGDYTYLWGAQLEAGAFPTSYIPTTTAAVTRAADSALMSGANFSSWYRQDEGTFVTKYTPNLNHNNNRTATQVDDGTSTNRMVMYKSSSGGSSACYGSNDDSSSFTLTGGVFSSEVMQALAYKVNDVCSANNGTLTLSDNSFTPPSVTTLNIGRGVLVTTGNINGHIARIAYYPKRLTNAELQGLSSL